MATVSVSITGTAKLTLTYSVANVNEISSRVKVTNWKFDSTRSGGVSKKYELYVGIASSSAYDISGAGASADSYVDSSVRLAILAAGTKTKSGTCNIWLEFDRTHSARTVSILSEAYLEATDSSGDTYINDVTFKSTIPAMQSYVVTLNANGGSGGTASLTKWYNETLSLTSGVTAPTRNGYRFAGWATTSDYPAHGSIISSVYDDMAQTVYAVWQPVISGIELSVSTLRVANGSAVAESDDGTWCYGTCDYIVSGAAAGSLTLTVSVSPSGPSIQTSTFTDSKLAGEPLTGSIVFRASGCSVDNKYLFEISASCTNSSTTQTAVTRTIGDWLSAAYFPLDILGDAYLYNLTEDATPSSSKTYYTRTGDGGEEHPFVYTEMPSSQQSFENGVDYYEANGPRPGHGIAFGLPATKEGVTVADRFRHLALDIERDVVPASSIYPGGLAVSDKNGVQIGYFQAVQLTDGNEGVQLGTGRNVNNSDIWHTMQMCINANGTVTVAFSYPNAWRNALGVTDSGWQTLTLGSAAKAYDSGTAPVYRKCFNVVNLVGAVSPKSQVAAGDAFDVGELPIGYRPKVAASTVCQGSGNSVYLLRVGTNGNIRVERYRNGASVNAAMSTTTWLPFNVTFICA